MDALAPAAEGGEKMKKDTLIVIGIVVALIILSFLVEAGLVWVICWAFNFTFTWKLALGVFAVSSIVSASVKSVNSGKN